MAKLALRFVLVFLLIASSVGLNHRRSPRASFAAIPTVRSAGASRRSSHSSPKQVQSPQSSLPRRRLTSLNMGLSDIPSSLMALRGGAAEITSTLTSALQSGPYGVLALWSIASAVVTPLTLYRQGYSFSVGYGFSVMAMGLSLLYAFQDSIVIPSNSVPFLLVAATIFYGFRLGTFLLIRNATVESKAKKLKEFDKTPLLKRIPLALSVSLFYAFMATPAMYALRAADQVKDISYVGVGIAWLGALLEATADAQKYIAKRGSKEGDKNFTGPTGGVYRISRHPNYLGEVVFWTGIFLGGAPSFGKSIIAWACSSMGLYGIFSIMTQASKRLDSQQADKYGGQEKYETWRKQVPSPLVPFITG